MTKKVASMIAKVGKASAKHAVCASSPNWFYQAKEPAGARQYFQKDISKKK